MNASIGNNHGIHTDPIPQVEDARPVWGGCDSAIYVDEPVSQAGLFSGSLEAIQMCFEHLLKQVVASQNMLPRKEATPCEEVHQRYPNPQISRGTVEGGHRCPSASETGIVGRISLCCLRGALLDAAV